MKYNLKVAAKGQYSTHSKDLCACRGPEDSAGQQQAGSEKRLWGMLGLRLILDRWVRGKLRLRFRLQKRVSDMLEHRRVWKEYFSPALCLRQ